jgi:hypothetical protein
MTNDRQMPLERFWVEDSASKKRWVLKFDDPENLAQIDAVFATLEQLFAAEKCNLCVRYELNSPLLFFCGLSGNLQA